MILATLMSSEPSAALDVREYGPSMLLAPGESELKLFHNLYTQTAHFDREGRRVDQGARSTWYTGTAALRVGWKPRVNAVVEITVRAVEDRTRPPDFDGRSGLTAFTPKLQLTPWARTRWLTLATGVRWPVGSELQGNARDPFLDFEDPFWIVQLLCDHDLSPGVRLYLEAGSWLRMAGEQSQLTTPVKIIVNLEPARRWTLYAPLEVSPDWLGDAPGYFTQAGVGAKLRVGAGAEVEALWTTFPAGQSAGAGQTFNLGIRFVR